MWNKTLCVILIVFSVIGCSQKADEQKVIQEFGDNPVFQSILEQESNENMSEEEAESYGLRCMIFANMGMDLDVSLLMSEKLKSIYKRFPDNGLILAYYGAAVGMIARDDTNVTNQMHFANKSVKMMDKAVELAQDDPIVRLTRGHLLYSLPASFNRYDTAELDYDYCISCYIEGSCSLPDSEMIQVFFNNGDLKRRKGDLETALDYYQQVVAIDSNTEYARKAEELTETLGEN